MFCCWELVRNRRCPRPRKVFFARRVSLSHERIYPAPGGEPLCKVAARRFGKEAAPGNVSWRCSTEREFRPSHHDKMFIAPETANESERSTRPCRTGLLRTVARWEMAASGAIPGSRLLAEPSSSQLQSGSPLGPGRIDFSVRGERWATNIFRGRRRGRLRVSSLRFLLEGTIYRGV
jgi:hypothetical protein